MGAGVFPLQGVYIWKGIPQPLKGFIHCGIGAVSYTHLSGGNTIQYDNPMAVQENGGWRYAYGNMFYARLVKQYLIE